MQNDFLSLGGGLFAVVIVLFYVSFIVFWMILAWRLMRAHERIASGVTAYVRSQLGQVNEG